MTWHRVIDYSNNSAISIAKSCKKSEQLDMMTNDNEGTIPLHRSMHGRCTSRSCRCPDHWPGMRYPHPPPQRSS